MSQCFTSPYYWGYFISNKYLVTGCESQIPNDRDINPNPCIWNVVISGGNLTKISNLPISTFGISAQHMSMPPELAFGHHQPARLWWDPIDFA